MSLWLTSLPRVTVTKAWVQSGRSQWAGTRAGPEGRRVGHSCLCLCPVLISTEISATMSFFSLCVEECSWCLFILRRLALEKVEPWEKSHVEKWQLSGLQIQGPLLCVPAAMCPLEDPAE